MNCSTRDCLNPAVAEAGGMPVCHVCVEVVSLSTTLAKANAELARFHVSIVDGWLDLVETKVREKVADEFLSMAEVKDVSPVMETVYKYTAKLALGKG